MVKRSHTKKVLISFPPDLYARLFRAVKRRELRQCAKLSLSEYVRQAVSREVDRPDDETEREG